MVIKGPASATVGCGWIVIGCDVLGNIGTIVVPVEDCWPPDPDEVDVRLPWPI